MLHLSFFGSLRVRLNDRPIDNFVSSKVELLLAYLVLTGQPHTRHSLAGLFWPDDSEQKAKNSLRVALSNLNKLLPGYLHADRLIVSFVQTEPHRLDTAVFNSLCQSDILDEQEEAAVLYRGDLLATFSEPPSAQLEEWLLAQQTAWRQKALALFSTLADAYLQHQKFPQAINILERRLAIDPLQETAHRQLMLAYSRTGNLAAARQQYETCRRLLAEALAITPMAQTADLYERIQLADEEPAHPTPHLPSPLIGRAAEIEQLLDWLTQPTCRLVSLIGLGGMGKTHLALTISQQVNQPQQRRFLNGVTFVPMQGILPDDHAANNMAQAIATALNITLPGRQPAPSEISQYLQPEERLLILDNLEHLLPHIGWLADLLTHCPHLKLLITSREALNLASEWRFDLSGLATASDDDQRSPAAELFVQTAVSQRPSFTLTSNDLASINSLCERVSGVPLAIKLAAFWLKTLTPADLVQAVEQNLSLLAASLPDLPPRQRSMIAILDTTWEMLEPPTQQTLARLSHFRGGFISEAARVVSDASPVDLLDLGDRGLLPPQTENGRYQLHELVRQYAAQKLRKMGEETAVANQHATFFARLAADHYPALISNDARLAMQTMRRERDNLRLAWRQLLQTSHLDNLDQMADGLGHFFYTDGSNIEGAQLFGEAAALVRQQRKRPSLQAKLHGWQAKFIYAQGFATQAETFFVLQREAAQAGGSVRQEAEAELGLALVANRNSQAERVRQHASQAHALFQQINDERGIIAALHQMGISHHIRGENIAAIGVYEQVLQTAESFNKLPAALSSLINIGYIQVDMGNYAEARRNLTRAEKLLKQMAFSRERARLLHHLARLTLFEGDLAASVRYSERSRAEHVRNGDRNGVVGAERWLAVALYQQGHVQEARRYVEHSLDLSRQLETETSITFATREMGMIEEADGNLREAAHWLAEALELTRAMGRRKDDVILNLGNLARVLTRLGELAAAKAYLQEAVSVAQEFPDAQHALGLLVDVAVYLWEGEKRPYPTQPILRTVLNSPGTRHEFIRRATALLAAIEAAEGEGGVEEVEGETAVFANMTVALKAAQDALNLP